MRKLFVFISLVLALNCNAQIIETRSSCDSNSDGKVSIEDVTNTINKVMGAIAEEREVVDAAGLNSLLLSLDNRLAAIEKEIGIMPGSAKYEDFENDGKVYKLGISGAIDLGLSVKWAAFNVDATGPAEEGGYYAWGETETKSVYNWSTYPDLIDENTLSFNKYASDKKTVLDPEDDVAHVKWRGAWRMPTWEELYELYTKLTWTLIQYKDKRGYLVAGNNGNAIFIPYAGSYSDGNLILPAMSFHYWSSTLDTSKQYSCNAKSLDLGLSIFTDAAGRRFYGQSIRPVCE